MTDKNQNNNNEISKLNILGLSDEGQLKVLDNAIKTCEANIEKQNRKIKVLEKSIRKSKVSNVMSCVVPLCLFTVWGIFAGIGSKNYVKNKPIKDKTKYVEIITQRGNVEWVSDTILFIKWPNNELEQRKYIKDNIGDFKFIDAKEILDEKMFYELGGKKMAEGEYVFDVSMTAGILVAGISALLSGIFRTSKFDLEFDKNSLAEEQTKRGYFLKVLEKRKEHKANIEAEIKNREKQL